MAAIKKIVSILVMILFVLSLVPLVWAENDGAKPAKPKGLLGITKEEIKQAQEQIKNFRENRELLKEQYNTHKEELSQLKEKVTKCKEDKEACKINNENWNKGVKQHLINTNNLIHNSLTRIKDQVEISTLLSEEDKTASLEKIAELEAKLTAELDKVNAMADTATKEELKTATKELKDIWQEVRTEQRKILTNLIRAKLENLVDKHDEYGNSIEVRIQELKAKGVDVSELKSLQEKFTEQMATLKEEKEVARIAWIEAKNSDAFVDTSNVMHQAQQKVKDSLAQTKETLREFMQKYRELKLTSAETPSDNINATTTA